MPIVGVVMEVILDIRFLIKEIATICIGNVGHALTIYNSYFLKKYTICLKVESKWFIFSLKGHALLDKASAQRDFCYVPGHFNPKKSSVVEKSISSLGLNLYISLIFRLHSSITNKQRQMLAHIYLGHIFLMTNLLPKAQDILVH